MKIKSLSGKEIDLNKLTDRDAEVAQAVNNLFETCKKYNCSIFARVLLNDRSYIGPQFIALNKDKKPNPDHVNFMFALINDFVETSTQGKVKLTQQDEENESFE